jgi:hypothetical protein
MALLEVAKYFATRVGELCSEDLLYRIDAGLNYLEVGRWMRSKGYDTSTRLRTREAIFDQIATEVGDRKVLYLEFGVWRGESIRYWSRLLKNPESHLHGFDSFEGLPDRWHARHGPGTFSTMGQPPTIDDGRVKFFKGWFHETLQGYSAPSHDVLVVNIDADLYSSATVVLTRLEELMSVGDYLYFDEFSDRHHELRAFDEFLARTETRFDFVTATRSLSNVAFRRRV